MNDSNNAKIDNTQTKPVVAPIAIFDCGQASKVTKGTLIFWLFEVGFPPFDRQLIF